MIARIAQRMVADRRAKAFRSSSAVYVLHKAGWVLMRAVAALFLVFAGQARASVDVTETWSNGDMAGWTNDPSISVLSNTSRFLDLQFTNQSSPVAESDVAYSGLSGVMPVTVSFRFSTADTYPSAIRLCLHCSTNDNLWYVTLPRPEVGVWTEYSVPVNFEQAAWVNGPENSKAQFAADMQSVNWIGVYVRRHGSTVAQKYGIDDVRIQGADADTLVTLSGRVGYDGELAGIVRVLAQWDGGTVETNIATPGAYGIRDAPILKTYTLTAYMDSNANGTQDVWEATGVYVTNPLTIGFVDVPNLGISMHDPKNAEGLPYWWVNQYFAPGVPLAADSDGDGLSNYAEWRAGTVPTNAASVFQAQMVEGSVITNVSVGAVEGLPYNMETKRTASVKLRWNSMSGRTYSIMYTDNLATPLRPLVTGVGANPPYNEQEFDVTGLPPGGRFYFRVKVE